VTHGQTGDVPARSQSLATSLATEVVRPPSARRRIDRYDGPRVTAPDRSPQSEQVERDTGAGSTVIGRMVPHRLPKGFPRRRDDGVQATKTVAKLRGRMQEALAHVPGLGPGASQIMASLPSRPRDPQRSGRDPVRGPSCQREMGVGRLWHPTEGLIHAERTALQRGQ